MKNHGKLPWLKVHDYLLQTGSCRTIPELIRTACTELERLVPFDTGAGFHLAIDAQCLCAVGISDRVLASYNEYYRMKQPGFFGTDGTHLDPAFMLATSVIEWRTYGNLEYAADFMLPNRMFKTLAHISPAQQIALSAHRSRLSPGFTDTDVAILDLLNQHLNNFYALFDQKNGPLDSSLLAQGIADQFHTLSQREAELCSLLCAPACRARMRSQPAFS